MLTVIETAVWKETKYDKNCYNIYFRKVYQLLTASKWNIRVCLALTSVYMNHLFSGEQCDGRDSVRILVAFCYGHLLKEIHLLLAGKEDDFGVTEHHDGVCKLIAKQPRLRMMGGK